MLQRNVHFRRLCVMFVMHMRDRWLTRWIKAQIYCLKSNSHLAQTHGKSHLFLPAPCGLTLGLIGDLTPITAEAGPPRCWWCVCALNCRRILSPGLFGGGSMASPTSLSHPEHSAVPQLGPVYFVEIDGFSQFIPPATGHYMQAALPFPCVSLTQAFTVTVHRLSLSCCCN